MRPRAAEPNKPLQATAEDAPRLNGMTLGLIQMGTSYKSASHRLGHEE